MHIKPRIMAVDDSSSAVELLKAMFEDEGYEIGVACNGFEALEALKEAPADLILLDLAMPRMDGIELCRLLRGDPMYRSIPIIILTALAQRENRLEGIKAGADDYILKPFEKSEILARVRSLLNTRELNARIERAYSSITHFISYTDLCLKAFNPLDYSIADALDGLADLFIRKNGKDMERPSHLLMTSQGYNPLYHFSAKGLTRWFIGLAPFPEGFKDGDGFTWNEGEEMPVSLSSSLSEVINRIGVVRNIVITGSGGFNVAAFNYSRSVDRMDIQLLKGFVIHNRFFKTLSDQMNETENAFLYTVGALARAAEANDDDTGSHIIRVGEYARAIAGEMRMPSRFAEEIRYSAQMHDVGKMHVPMEILKKPSKLTDEEFEAMKSHTVYGAKILGDAPKLSMCRTISLSHHERYDGSGYPYGLKGEDIPLEGRIVAIADLYDALRSPRIYKPAFSHDDAVRIIAEGDGRTMPAHFDPDVFRVFKGITGLFEEIFERWKKL